MNKCTQTTFVVKNETYPVSIIRKQYIRFSIRVRFNLRIFINCPDQITDDKALEYLNENLDWLENTIDNIKQKLAFFPIQEVKAGKKLVWFGDLLTVVRKEGLKVPFKFENDRLYVPYSYFESEREIEKFARSIIIEKYDEWLHRLIPNPSTFLPLTFRMMRARWGSYNVKTKHVILNSKLYYLPLGLFAYVIIHELLHYHYPNHGKAFHARLEKIISEHRKYEKELKKYEILIS